MLRCSFTVLRCAEAHQGVARALLVALVGIADGEHGGQVSRNLFKQEDHGSGEQLVVAQIRDCLKVLSVADRVQR